MTAYTLCTLWTQHSAVTTYICMHPIKYKYMCINLVRNTVIETLVVNIDSVDLRFVACVTASTAA